MNKEIKYFLWWLLNKNNFTYALRWFSKKLYYKFFKKNNLYKYPIEILNITEKLNKPEFENKIQNRNKFFINVSNFNLASKEIIIDTKKIEWLKNYTDSEDIESMHRWNWMVHKISKKNNQMKIDQLLFYQRDWYYKFFDELKLKKNLQFLRWSSYSVAERVSNSIIIFNYYNYKIPSDIAYFLNQQIYFLSKNLEYFGKKTGNHIINNARALYLYSTYTGNNQYRKIAKSIFYEQINRIITKDGFLREGSSHYHFLILRWVLEVYYFSIKFNDVVFSKYLSSYIFNLTEKSIHFLYKDDNESLAISLFGDISPDFEPEWLANLIYSKIMPFNIKSAPICKIPIYSWNNLWSNVSKINSDPNLSIDYKLNEINHIYKDSGWYFLNNNKTRALIRADNKSIQNNVGHYNQDLFHINILFNDIPFLVSLGRLNYNKKDEIANFGIYSKSHNSILVNNLSYLPDKVNFFPIKYIQADNDLFYNKHTNELIVSSNCFKRIDPSLIISRKILLKKEHLDIYDIIEGSGEYLVSKFFYFHNKLTLKSNRVINKNKRVIEFSYDKKFFYFEIHCSNVERLNISVLNKNKEVYSYGKYNLCIGIKIENKRKLPNQYLIRIK